MRPASGKILSPFLRAGLQFVKFYIAFAPHSGRIADRAAETTRISAEIAP
jgi:hypothetical protein